ncbi:hypothetical protein BDP27DRAFT_1444255 [Rhodocollybia butyracea]|uniref:Uncharacterized protein n=1 Tax=Rhodocollybia butyracea TaxID=206335 RepID=A0A9P5UDM8_9AGAR|nr:hypothetical protein BDP27DRAFT_1444255 [Rhodocollybia butyracea]
MSFLKRLFFKLFVNSKKKKTMTPFYHYGKQYQKASSPAFGDSTSRAASHTTGDGVHVGRLGWPMSEKFLGALPAYNGSHRDSVYPNRIVHDMVYSRKGDAEERTLQQLLKQQREKVEEIKKKTNYYSTRELLQRYDDSPFGFSTSTKARSSAAFSASYASTSKQPRDKTTARRLQLSTTPATPPEPPRRQWIDKIVDVVLGDDDAARFALISFKADSPSSAASRSPVSQTLRQRSQAKSPLANKVEDDNRMDIVED